VSDLRKVISPGRVNLIGEHTDYSYGYVMPMAIDLHTTFLYAAHETISVYSSFFNEFIEVGINPIRKTRKWIDYILGIYYVLFNMNLKPGGIKGELQGNLPIGVGLSSSASLEMAVAMALNEDYALGLNRLEMAMIGKKAENDFIGIPSGILDQFAVSFGKENHAIFLDTESLHYEYIPFPSDVQVIVFNTGIKRELASTEYANRKRIVENSLEILKKKSSKYVEEKDLMVLPKLYAKRMGYVVRENMRVLMARDFLKSGRIEEFGRLLVESHNDIANNYEVSSPELDFIVSESLKQKALGARLTGAGFGGSAIILSYKEQSSVIAENLYKEYRRHFNLEASYYFVHPSEGVTVV